MSSIDITGINKAQLLIALYDHANVQGLGMFQSTSSEMTVEEAERLLKSHNSRFDYLKGRVMKIDISEDTVSPFLYDRDNGEGAVQSVVDSLKE